MRFKSALGLCLSGGGYRLPYVMLWNFAKLVQAGSCESAPPVEVLPSSKPFGNALPTPQMAPHDCIVTRALVFFFFAFLFVVGCKASRFAALRNTQMCLQRAHAPSAELRSNLIRPASERESLSLSQTRLRDQRATRSVLASHFFATTFQIVSLKTRSPIA